MLIKEYRISLPMSVEEYRIAQLYMIQRKSREESHGTESGVEIIENKPYSNGPGGSGQYTYKIYHIGSHLPGWFRAILPKSALRVEEEAWNAYPYTKTRFKCPFIEKFLLEVETKYINDAGDTDGVFNLSKSEKAQTVVDYIDIVKDGVTGHDYKKEEDPKLFVSTKTGRGPLSDDWRNEYGQAIKTGKGGDCGAGQVKEMMTAYKLCRVEFKYWGMQNKIERFIHDVALRKTMLRAHRQAWAWQDEYYGLTLDDIRALERETQLALAEKMAAATAEAAGEGAQMPAKSSDISPADNSDEAFGALSEPFPSSPASFSVSPSTRHQDVQRSQQHQQQSQSPAKSSVHFSTTLTSSGPPIDLHRSTSQESTASTVVNGAPGGGSRGASSSSLSSLSQQRRSSRSRNSPVEWSSLEKLQEPSSDEEFFDAQEDMHQQVSFEEPTGLIRSSSMEFISGLDDNADVHSYVSCVAGDESQFDKRVEHFRQMYSVDSSLPATDTSTTAQPVCPTQILFLVLHGGNVLDSNQEVALRRCDLINLKATFDSIIQAHYPLATSQVAFRLVSSPYLCSEALVVLSRLSPFNCEGHPPGGSKDTSLTRNQHFVPLGAIALFATAGPEYQDHVNTMVMAANQIYHDFLQSDEGRGFSGQVCLLADAMGSLLAYDALAPFSSALTRHGSRYGSHESVESSAMGPVTSNVSHNSRGIGNTNIASYRMREMSLSDPHIISEEIATRVGSESQGASLPTSSSPSNQDAAVSGAALSSSPPNTSFMSHGPGAGIGYQRKGEKSRSEIGIPDAAGVYPSIPSGTQHNRKIPCDEGTYSGQAQVSPSAARHHLLSCEIGRGGDWKDKDSSRRTSSGSHFEGGIAKFDFDVTDVFMCGAPLGMVLAYRKAQKLHDNSVVRPACHQVYNLFHSNDPTAVRLEPLINDNFSHIPPVNVCRYTKFPLGDGEPVHVVETIQSHLKLFTQQQQDKDAINSKSLQRQASFTSVCSTSSGLGDNTVSCITSVTRNWWGAKRMDYVLYCPEALHSFPTNALPHLFHSSFWESTDVAAFILRQVLKQNEAAFEPGRGITRDTMASFKIKTPREKWLKRKTTIKVRNLQPNHRANDVIALEDGPQILSAKFMYGSLDITSLSGEKVDVHIMKQPPTGDWIQLGTEQTDSHGRFTYTIPPESRLSQGMYPIKLIVRGDHTSVDMYLAVLPPKTETVAFSIDGSFTASVSIMGKDPKVRAGAVDVVRQWSDLGYLILYVSARPDLQHRKVVAWLAQHNFPHGIVAFMDGLSKDPLKQKYNYIRSLQTEAKIDLRAAYGSNKDIGIYHDLGLQAHQIFIVGKASKKQHSQAQILSDGYSAHLSQLMSPGFTRPASGNARMFLRKANFRLSARDSSTHREGKKLARRAVSHPAPTTYAAEGFTKFQSAEGATTKIVVEDFSSVGGGNARTKEASPRLNLPPHGKSVDV
ncbi:membrane-associated phosphatidylinositol transfer protein 2 [Plakobranchus ocellatus]|uniref:Membrane-associated phosphatidylinositol transfer protein 2 n=1 Tax=Plakobranchus ocellatus TaxID=259542 RepID=A0AAV3Z573_9GAST|nr:membrane-associated phosphatidylinositol transfer protein 2 [Plakobranchus ocellatus]